MGTNEIKTLGFFLSPDCVFGAELGAVLGPGQLMAGNSEPRLGSESSHR